MTEDFFFQAEDGIRDDLVTGVQTCALPICMPEAEPIVKRYLAKNPSAQMRMAYAQIGRASCRGKSVDLGGRRIIKKKKRRTRGVPEGVETKSERWRTRQTGRRMCRRHEPAL